MAQNGSDVKTGVSLSKDLILGEITGKNNAIHAYDKICWTIRSGYLTLLFGGWALLLQNAMDKKPDPALLSACFFALLVISCCFSTGAFIMDRSYLRRKFRVIAALNQLLRYAVNDGDIATMTEKEQEVLNGLICVSGDKGDKSYKTPGYQTAFKDEMLIYALSLLGVAVAGWLYISLAVQAATHAQ